MTISDLSPEREKDRLAGHIGPKGMEPFFMEEAMNDYAWFLEDGDFEKWMPCCFSNCDDTYYEQRKKEMLLLSVDESQDHDSINYKRAKTRLLWIQNRFNQWGGKEWLKIENQIKALKNNVTDQERMIPYP